MHKSFPYAPICPGDSGSVYPSPKVMPARAIQATTAIPLAIAATCAISAPAQAVSFRFDFANGVSDEFQQATQTAADRWSSVLKDDVVVDLRIEYSDLSAADDAADSVLGGIQPGKVKVKYEDYVSALLRDSVSSTDFQALNSLQLSAKGREALQDVQLGTLNPYKAKLDSKSFAFLMDGQFAKGNQPAIDFIDNNGNDNNKNLQLTRAQAKSLGLVDAQKRGLDGLIKLNSSVAWDTDSSDGVDADKYDLSTVLTHEIGHALGIVSGVDALDFLASTSELTDTDPADVEKNKFSYLTPLDLYRYSEESADLGVMDLTLGGSEKYFSLDGGQSAITDEQGRGAYFSTGTLSAGGDGYQGSHWKASATPLGVMNPLLQKGQSIDVSSLDLTLLDSIGWNLTDTNATRAAAVGLDWDGLVQSLARDRDRTTSQIFRTWGKDIPEIEAALSEASIDVEGKFQTELQEEFDSLMEKLEGETQSGKRQEAIAKFYEKVDEEAIKRNEALAELPEDIYKTDQEVREWLSKSSSELAKKLKDADGATMNRLSNIVKSAPRSERKDLEDKLEDALSQFTQKPNKLVEKLLETSGPANPVSRFYAYRWWWYWQEADNEFDDDFDDFEDFFYAATAAPSAESGDFSGQALLPRASGNSLSISSFSAGEAKDVPEPSSVLALFGIAALGMTCGRKRR